ncbi:MAG: TauD/TfdA dioxygenase family protein [Rhodospirillales bacterium]
MPIAATPLHPLFAARLDGADLRRADDGDVAAILDMMARYGVCVVPHDTPLTDEEHIAFSARLGPIERKPILTWSGGKPPRIPHFEIIDQSNLDENGAIFREDDRRLAFKRANRLWHTDVSFHPVRATYSVFSCHLIPPGGAPTEFTDMRAVYDALPDATKARLDGLVGEHSYWHSRVLGGGPEPTAEERESRPPAHHALVHVHAPSGRKALYLASHIARILGMPDDEGRALVQELTAFATQPRFVYRHHWQVGEIVIWDNLCTMHRATPFDDTRHPRDMRRTTCREGALAQEALL